jgi:hypothetical protein
MKEGLDTREIVEKLELPHDLERAWLIRWLVVARFHREHEMTFRIILGSQIELLQLANTGVPPDMDGARAIFEKAKATYPDLYAGFSYEAWLNYPLNRGLARLDGARIRTTPIGQIF